MSESPTDVLRHEHDVVLVVVQAMEDEAASRAGRRRPRRPHRTDGRLHQELHGRVPPREGRARAVPPAGEQGAGCGRSGQRDAERTRSGPRCGARDPDRAAFAGREPRGARQSPRRTLRPMHSCSGCTSARRTRSSSRSRNAPWARTTSAASPPSSSGSKRRRRARVCTNATTSSRTSWRSRPCRPARDGEG